MVQAAKTRQTAEVVKLREADGWRRGKPIEDPEKLKRWGFITAKPSEYLVHVRRGKVVTKSSGQGATCFKWPMDAVAVIPTSLQQLQFKADQVTAEKVGIEVVGLAVYRIAEPLLAYRVLNFSYPERAQEKLEETLTAMFVGAARRLIANLAVDDCLQKRKSAIAEELLREIAPVVGGFGRIDDSTEQGWGVVIDTIEIQEVRVLSEKVFAAMQAPYRAGLDRRAREAKAIADRDIAQREAECSREIAEAQIGSKRTVEKLKLETEAQLRAERSAIERRDAEEAAKLAVRKTELSAIEAKAALEAFELEMERRAKAAELARADAVAAAELRKREVELAREEGRMKAEVELALAEAAIRKSEAEARVIGAEKLPELASAIGAKIGEVRIAQYGGDGNPFHTLTQSVAAVLDLVKRA